MNIAMKETLSANLRHVMTVRGVDSQVQLAKLSGVSQTMLGMVLRAERDTTTGTLDRIAAGLRVPAWALLVNPCCIGTIVAVLDSAPAKNTCA